MIIEVETENYDALLETHRRRLHHANGWLEILGTHKSDKLSNSSVTHRIESAVKEIAAIEKEIDNLVRQKAAKLRAPAHHGLKSDPQTIGC
jgi:uncharacterized protein Yka (UPF0111/DUF47 family)